jgi:hypothetical protein
MCVGVKIYKCNLQTYGKISNLHGRGHICLCLSFGIDPPDDVYAQLQ